MLLNAPPTLIESQCEYLAWDSNFFGLRIARLGGGRLTAGLIALAAEYCSRNLIDCLYFLADSDNPETLELARANGFQLVDVRVTMERTLQDVGDDVPPAVRPVQAHDRPRLREIARASHWQSRFYADPRFPRQSCDKLYETWIERSCEGWANAVFVADCDGGPCGYLTCHARSTTECSIGLVAVDSHYWGRGFGRQLVETGLHYFHRSGMERTSVVTQGRNVASQRLYQRCGFLTGALQLWYHWWPGRQHQR